MAGRPLDRHTMHGAIMVLVRHQVVLRHHQLCPHDPDAVVGDLLAMLDAFSLDKVPVLGFSYSSQLAQRLVVRAPARFRALVIASSSIYPP